LTENLFFIITADFGIKKKKIPRNFNIY